MLRVKKTDKVWAEGLIKKIVDKELKVADRNRNKIPYTTEAGVFDDWSDGDRVCWWTNGFWAGMLWLLYDYSEEELFKEVAQGIEAKLDRNLLNYNGMDHDSGFKWLLTSVASYKLTGSAESKNRALLAAANLAGRFNLKAGLIRAWNDENGLNRSGWAIIDCMMNLPLLYWASEELCDPRFSQIAKSHADNAMKYFIREDGSVRHIISFDAATGRYIESFGGQGKEHGSSWTRGQSWALYGFALSYRHTGDEKYLEAAKKVATYILSNIDEAGVMPVDFWQDKELDWEDSTAAAIMACGFLELCQYVGGTTGEEYYSAALLLLRTLENHSTCFDENIDYILDNCTAAYNDEKHNFSIIYGDYYFTEALLKLCGGELFLW